MSRNCCQHLESPWRTPRTVGARNFVNNDGSQQQQQQQQFPAPKFRPAPDSQTNVVYKIPCANCSWCYIGETGRAFNIRRKERIRNVKTAAKGSRIANHTRSHDHSIDFNNASVIDKGNFRIKKTLESWHSMVTPNADNNSCPLPGKYNILFTHIHN